MTLKAKKYAVIGHPIKHSKSPLIHKCFAGEFRIQLIYDRIDIAPGMFSKEIIRIKKQGYLGLNVTLPFKREAFSMCDKLSVKSQLTESVNTITFENEKSFGDSTDGIGLVRDLQQKKVQLSGSMILLLGAGGAANGVMFDLITQNPKTIHILNRTLEKAKLMESKWRVFAKKHKVHLEVIDLSALDKKNYKLVINATSSGLVEGTLPIPKEYFYFETIYYDMTYGFETPFMKASKEMNAKTYDGLGMLIEQAAESFYIWHQLKPSTTNILPLL